jgi:hypothetical protein
MAFGDFTVTRASTKNVLGSAGLYVSVANDTPAFEFNTDGTYRGLLVEPGATNLLLRSQEFQTTWSVVGVAVTSNSTVAPDGATTGDTITADGLASTHRIFQAVTGTSGLVYTASVFVKAGTNNFVQIAISGATPFGITNFANFDLSAGTVGLTGGGQSGSIQDVGDGWYRISSTITAIGTGAGQVDFVIIENANSARLQSWTTSNTLILWQAQVETGSVATSPIVTTAGTASRVADVVSLTGASSLIGQSAGTVFLEVTLANATTASFGRVLEVGSNTTNRISIDANSSTLLGFITTGGVATQGGTMSEASANNVSYKVALAYAVGASQGAFYVNGTGDITSPTAIPASNDVYIGRSSAGANGVVAWYRSVALFPTRLANATLASLTA